MASTQSLASLFIADQGAPAPASGSGGQPLQHIFYVVPTIDLSPNFTTPLGGLYALGIMDRRNHLPECIICGGPIGSLPIKRSMEPNAQYTGRLHSWQDSRIFDPAGPGSQEIHAQHAWWMYQIRVLTHHHRLHTEDGELVTNYHDDLDSMARNFAISDVTSLSGRGHLYHDGAVCVAAGTHESTHIEGNDGSKFEYEAGDIIEPEDRNWSIRPLANGKHLVMHEKCWEFFVKTTHGYFDLLSLARLFATFRREQGMLTMRRVVVPARAAFGMTRDPSMSPLLVADTGLQRVEYHVRDPPALQVLAADFPFNDQERRLMVMRRNPMDANMAGLRRILDDSLFTQSPRPSNNVIVWNDALGNNSTVSIDNGSNSHSNGYTTGNLMPPPIIRNGPLRLQDMPGDVILEILLHFNPDEVRMLHRTSDIFPAPDHLCQRYWKHQFSRGGALSLFFEVLDAAPPPDAPDFKNYRSVGKQLWRELQRRPRPISWVRNRLRIWQHTILPFMDILDQLAKGTLAGTWCDPNRADYRVHALGQQPGVYANWMQMREYRGQHLGGFPRDMMFDDPLHDQGRGFFRDADGFYLWEQPQRNYHLANPRSLRCPRSAPLRPNCILRAEFPCGATLTHVYPSFMNVTTSHTAQFLCGLRFIFVDQHGDESEVSLGYVIPINEEQIRVPDGATVEGFFMVNDHHGYRTFGIKLAGHSTNLHGISPDLRAGIHHPEFDLETPGRDVNGRRLIWHNTRFLYLDGFAIRSMKVAVDGFKITGIGISPFPRGSVPDIGLAFDWFEEVLRQWKITKHVTFPSLQPFLSMWDECYRTGSARRAIAF